MPDQPTTHREFADLYLEQARRSPALTEPATMATLHLLAHIADVTDELHTLVEALAGPAAVQDAEAGAIDDPRPAECNLCGGTDGDHQPISIYGPEGGPPKRITCPRDLTTDDDVVYAPVYTFPARPDSKDRIS